MAHLLGSRVARVVRAALSTDLDRRGRGYRRAIDGYRGLFILLVVAYHFGVTGLVGGWIGINHFFVFSGFLIATMLIKERERTGAIDAWTFYVRRARRIVPAMTVLVLAVLAHTALDGGETHRARTAGDAFATATFWLNWRLIARNDQYFDLFDAPSPLRHVWTLAVEEQFYLFVPALIGLLYLASRRKMVRAAVVAALAVLGAGWTAHLVSTSTATFSRLYYGTDVRSQALLVGVAVAFLHTKVRGVRRREIPIAVANTFGIIGTIASVSAFFVLGDASIWVFRDGGLLLFAILAALMGVSALDSRDLLINRVVGNRVLVHFGQISYGMYLYHWPISLWLHVPHAPVFLQGTVQFLVTWCVAVASYRLLEIPVMQYGFGRLVRRGRMWAGPAVAASVAVLALVAQFVLPPADASTWNGVPPRPCGQLHRPDASRPSGDRRRLHPRLHRGRFRQRPLSRLRPVEVRRVRRLRLHADDGRAREPRHRRGPALPGLASAVAGTGPGGGSGRRAGTGGPGLHPPVADRRHEGPAPFAAGTPCRARQPERAARLLPAHRLA